MTPRRVTLLVLVGSALGFAAGLFVGQRVAPPVPAAASTPIPSKPASVEAFGTQTLDGLEEHIRQAGLTVGERSEFMHQLLPAEEGYRLRVNGEDVEIVAFNLSITSGRDALEALRRDGFGGGAYFINGRVAMYCPKHHPDEAQVVNAFMSF